jgi:drug/metabolite transporter (DMT)-like permease
MYVVSKYVLVFVPPFTLVALRLAIASVVLLGLLAARRQLRVPRRELPLIALCGLIGYPVSLGAQFAGTHLSTAHDAALITSTTPAFVAAFAALLLRERVGITRGLAISLATLGVVVVALGQGGGEDGAASLLGDALLVVAALTWALYSVLTKAATVRRSVLVATTYSLAFGFVFALPTASLELGGRGLPPVPPLAWWGVLYLGVVSTAVAFYLWNKGLALLDASVASLLFFGQPVVGSALGWLILGESLSPSFCVGAVLVVGGVLLASREAAGG